MLKIKFSILFKAFFYHSLWNAHIPATYAEIFEYPWDALIPYKLYPFIKSN